MKTLNTFCAVLVLGFLAAGCVEDGKEGTASVDCGAHGSAHAGHCHCDDGFLWDGVRCVVPEDIIDVCAEEREPEGTDEEEHEHTACRCPQEGECPCDHGQVQVIANEDYCIPELDEE